MPPEIVVVCPLLWADPVYWHTRSLARNCSDPRHMKAPGTLQATEPSADRMPTVFDSPSGVVLPLEATPRLPTFTPPSSAKSYPLSGPYCDPPKRSMRPRVQVRCPLASTQAKVGALSEVCQIPPRFAFPGADSDRLRYGPSVAKTG